jgi:hypothetical protein
MFRRAWLTSNNLTFPTAAEIPIGPDGIGWIERWQLTLRKIFTSEKLPTEELKNLTVQNETAEPARTIR